MLKAFFDTIRKQTHSKKETSLLKTIGIWLIFGTIIVVFVFWGVGSVDAPSSGFAATVNNDVISLMDFKRESDRQLEFYASLFGGVQKMPVEQKARLQSMVLDRMISEKLLSQGAEKQGFHVTDSEIRDQITSIPAFYQDGRFKREIYQAYIQQSRSTAAQFEAGLRSSLQLNHARELISLVFEPSEQEVATYDKLQNTKVSVDFVGFDADDKNQWTRVGQSEAQSFLTDHKNEVESYYQKNLSQYSEPEQIRARHILIRSLPGKEAEAKVRAEQIHERLKKENFEKVAKETSEDPATKSKGGDLGYFSKGRMVPEFEKVAFELSPDIISQPIKTQYGFHIIKVLDKKKATSKELKEVELNIAKKLVFENKTSEFAKKANEILKSNSKNKSQELNQLVSQYGLQWQNTGLFDAKTPEVPKVGAIEDFHQAALGLTKEEPLPSGVVRYASKVFVLKLKDRQVPQKSLSKEELGKLKTQLSQGRTIEILGEWEQHLAKKGRITKNSQFLSQL